jgi:hypothetical protein
MFTARLKRALQTWSGKVTLGLIVLATLALIAHLNPIHGTFTYTTPGVNDPNARNGIVIEKEHFVQGPGGDVRAIARIDDEHFVIAGVRGVGWAVGAGAAGDLTWVYKEPFDPQVKTQYQSEFHGVVPMPDGHVLLCGENSTNEFGAGLITILDAEGNLIERRTVFPNDDRKNWGSSFQGCIPWGDGFALLGRGTDGKHGFFWLMKLDQHGKTMWDKIGPEIPGFGAAAAQDGSLVMVGNIGGMAGGVTVTRFDQNGEKLASRNTDFLEAKFVRSLNPSNTVQLVLTNKDFQDVLLTLDVDLRDIEKPRRLTLPNIRDGCAYELSDGSIVKFGSIVGSVGSVFRASVGWMNRRNGEGQLRVFPLPNPHDSSNTVRDAVAISPNQFVAVRTQNSTDQARNGFVLSWIILK